MLKFEALAARLWGHKARFAYLSTASVLLIFAFLGARDIWTQEHRWADIVSGMFYRQDFLHPYLGEVRYYDKPLLSYWLIVLAAKAAGVLNNTVLRFPTACSGLLAVFSIVSLGRSLRSRELGLLAGWLLLTTFYFLFWARVSSSDMLNMAGSLFAIAWYISRREQISFFNYAVFFVIVVLTCLCKGLVGAVTIFIAISMDMLLQRSWSRHLNVKLVFATFPALLIYFLPFAASSYFDTNHYQQSGLYLVYKENILRYFQPFDHQGPIYTYLMYLPIYTLPWALFLVPALVSCKSRWSGMSLNSRWIGCTLLALFLFFSLSGSRRSYYVLPMVPFAILFLADWLMDSSSRTKQWAAGLVACSFILLFLLVDAVPAWYYAHFGASRFAQLLKDDAQRTQPWNKWNVVLLDAESKINFYLQLPPTTQNYAVLGKDRSEQSALMPLARWPILESKPVNTIFITRKLYAEGLKPYFAGYHVIEIGDYPTWPFLKNYKTNAPVAFVP